MVGLTLPFIFPWDSSANAGKASGDRLRSELEYARARRRIDNDKSVLLSQAASLKIQLDNITQKLLPRAKKRMKVVHNVAPRDAETLQDQRETFEAFPDLSEEEESSLERIKQNRHLVTALYSLLTIGGGFVISQSTKLLKSDIAIETQLILWAAISVPFTIWILNTRYRK
jgi:hypothetical protein